MNRLIMIAATGFLALTVTACDKGPSKSAGVKTDTVVTAPTEDKGASTTTTTVVTPTESNTVTSDEKPETSDTQSH